jgi:O-acetyl-ADP-ribose deacetylase (regulator of RNase III)
VFFYTSGVYFEVKKPVHRVKIHQGDITKLAVDAIVCASAGCSESATESTGDNYLSGEVSITAADNLRADFIIHTLRPVWRGGDCREEEQLAVCYHRVMDAAKQQNIKSIAFPVISCGASGFPTRRAVKIAIREVNQALRQNPLLESVVFCCFDPVTTALYRTQVGK